MRNTVATILRSMVAGQEAIAAVLLFLMMAITFADVVGRYFFTAPIFGAAEMIQVLLALLIFAGLGPVNATDDHITVELLEDRVRRIHPPIHRFLVQALSVAMMAVISWQMISLAVDYLARNRRTIVLEWPLGVVLAIVAALAIASFIAQLLGFLVPRENTATDGRGDTA